MQINYFNIFPHRVRFILVMRTVYSDLEFTHANYSYSSKIKKVVWPFCVDTLETKPMIQKPKYKSKVISQQLMMETYCAVVLTQKNIV